MNPPTIGTHPAHPVDPTHDGWYGLTKREYFAALAMHGFITAHKKLNGSTCSTQEDYAKAAIICADMLIEQLNKKENETNQTVIPDIDRDTTGENPDQY